MSKNVLLILAYLWIFFAFFYFIDILAYWIFFTGFWSLQTSLWCIMWELARGGSLAVGVSDRWQALCDTWHMTCDRWHMKHELFIIFLFSPFLSVLVLVLLSAHVKRLCFSRDLPTELSYRCCSWNWQYSFIMYIWQSLVVKHCFKKFCPSEIKEIKLNYSKQVCACFLTSNYRNTAALTARKINMEVYSQ